MSGSYEQTIDKYKIWLELENETLVEFTSAPSINSITTETVKAHRSNDTILNTKERREEEEDESGPEKVQEGEESLVGEAHSKGNAIQYNSHVPCHPNIFSFSF